MNETLKKHFLSFYQRMSEQQLIPQARFEKIGSVYRSLTGVPIPYLNGIVGIPEGGWDQFINQQLDYFKACKVPFAWYIDEDSHSRFKELLESRHFQNVGIFQGVSGPLTDIPEVSKDWELERVESESVFDEFNDVVCTAFEIHGVPGEMYKRALFKAMQGNKLSHWVARKEGKVVSALSTFIQDKRVSFWNGATVPEFRRQGLSTALRCFALKNAFAKGCRLGSSYLMAEGLALGICRKLGYQTEWRFHAFVSPTP